MNTSSKPIPAAKMPMDTSVAKQSFAPPGGFNMWRLFKGSSVSGTRKG